MTSTSRITAGSSRSNCGIARISLITRAERGNGLAHGGRCPPLDALGKFNLALTRQQRHRPHLAQVHAHHWVVGLVVDFLDQVEFAGFFGFLNLLYRTPA